MVRKTDTRMLASGASPAESSRHAAPLPPPVVSPQRCTARNYAPVTLTSARHARKPISSDWLPHWPVVPVASLEDVIRSKEAAGRAKDLQQLPTLRVLLREMEKIEKDPRE